MSESKKVPQSQPNNPPVQQQLLSIKPKKPQVPVEEKTPAKTNEEIENKQEVKEVSAVKADEIDGKSQATTDTSVASDAYKPRKPIPAVSKDKPSSSSFSSSSSTTSSTSSPRFQKPIPRKPQPPPYKNLEEFTTTNGETFVVGEQIKIATTNYGDYTVEIKFIYEASDGSVWTSYSHIDREIRHPWRWGCCRVEKVKKLDLSA
ncbi:MAG: hypothetical protein HC907_33775 [Richelia sp. SM1_7_0]|nr:hypothetical protein [Richelia sp. SM1_7_0]